MYRVSIEMSAVSKAFLICLNHDRDLIKGFLESSGCWDNLQFKPGEQERFVEVAPQ